MTIERSAVDRSALDVAAHDLEDGLAESVIETDHPVGELTTYRVGGSARFFCDVQNEADLVQLVQTCRARSLPIMMIGLGSNLLIPDAGFQGLAIRLGEPFGEVQIDDTTVHAGAAAALPRVARQTVGAGLTGFEWAVGVPGSIGGAIRMNAGGHGSDMSESVTRVFGVDLTTGERFTILAESLEFSYRHSAVRADQCVTSVELSLVRVSAPGENTEGDAELSAIVRWRRENQPGGQNAGSVFVNPDDDSAGRLIDAAGCKGLRVGSAVISDKHANFIQVDPDGSADDVLELMDLVIQRVREHSEITLTPETRVLGMNYLMDSNIEPTTDSSKGRSST